VVSVVGVRVAEFGTKRNPVYAMTYLDRGAA